MSNKNVLADLISGHLAEARIRVEQNMTRAERSLTDAEHRVRAASVARAAAPARVAQHEAEPAGEA